MGVTAARVGRAETMGVDRLPRECLPARTSTHEWGPDDPRVLCHGRSGWADLVDERCEGCPAYVWNAGPWEGGAGPWARTR